jgi:leucyl aminopeptidase
MKQGKVGQQNKQHRQKLYFSRARRAPQEGGRIVEVKVLPVSRWKGSDQSMLVFAAESSPAPMGWKGGEGAVKRLMSQAKEEGFTGKAGQVVMTRPEESDPARRVFLAGLGSLQGLSPEAFRVAAGEASKAAALGAAKGLSALFPERGDPAKIRRCAQSIIEGALLAQYQFNAYRTSPADAKKPLEHFVILHGDDVAAKEVAAGAAVGECAARSAMLARDLVNEPPSVMNPAKLAERAGKIGGRVRAKVFDLKWMERTGMGGVTAVGRGSHCPPVFIWLHYQGSKPKAKVALVGKGVTFDAGGLDLKDAESMEAMKSDMAGAAAVMAVMHAADVLKLPITIDGYIPAVENMPGGGAVKPGDVVKTLSGKTVEIINTDAEGRLILVDALAYAVKDKPDHVIDVATLTGGAKVALGTRVTGIMGTDSDLVSALISAGEDAGEPMWQLPLVREYSGMLKGRIADLKNTGRKREASTILGGLFLKEFTGNASWAHLDIAGTAYADKELPYCPRGGTGVPVRSLIAYFVKLSS